MKLFLNKKIYISVITISIFSFIFLIKITTSKELLNLSKNNVNLIDSLNVNCDYDNNNSIKFLQINKLTSSNWETINSASLVKNSSKFFIFFSENDCDFCVHQLIHELNKYLTKDKVVIIPLCYEVKALRFFNRNYQTSFEFYTTCPIYGDWIKNVPSPFIIYVDNKSYVKGMLHYEMNDTNKIKSFIAQFSKN